MSDRARELLELFYVPEAIYLKDIVKYSREQQSATGRFVVPLSHSYSHQLIEYVTAEQHIRCLSQLSYVTIGFLIRDEAPHFAFTDFRTFTQLMVTCQMWFRRTNLHYLKNVTKGTEFDLTLTLKEVKKLRIFSVCILNIRGVIRGTLEFVAPLNTHG